MQGRIYTAVMEAVAETTTQDLMELAAAADVGFTINEMLCTQETIQTSEMLPLRIMRRSTANTGGFTLTPVVNHPTTIASSVTVKTEATTFSALGTAGDVMWRAGMNILNGWHYMPLPEDRFYNSGSDRCVINLPAAPDGSTTFSITLIFEEFGG